LVVFSNKDVKSVEDDDQSKVPESNPCEVWLEGAFEDKRVAIDALSLEGLVELDIRQTDGAPGEQRADCGQVLEPIEDD
jgi:hypothetical protein